MVIPLSLIVKNLGLDDSYFALIMSYLTFNLPYVIWMLLSHFESIPKELDDACAVDGCTRVQSFFKVELPNVMPGIVTGFIMAFTLSLDDFVISYFCAGSDFQTLPILIYSMTKKEVKPDIYALSTLIIIAILTLLILTNLSEGKGEGLKDKLSDRRSRRRIARAMRKDGGA